MFSKFIKQLFCWHIYGLTDWFVKENHIKNIYQCIKCGKYKIKTVPWDEVD